MGSPCCPSCAGEGVYDKYCLPTQKCLQIVGNSETIRIPPIHWINAYIAACPVMQIASIHTVLS